jgi:hypothetical protein
MMRIGGGGGGGGRGGAGAGVEVRYTSIHILFVNKTYLFSKTHLFSTTFARSVDRLGKEAVGRRSSTERVSMYPLDPMDKPTDKPSVG